jgi:hypothetical protein
MVGKYAMNLPPAHLDSLILRSVGLEEESDEVFDFYYELIEKHSRKIRAERESMEKQAFKVYVALMSERKRRLGRRPTH